jgi:hypothetical protein
VDDRRLHFGLGAADKADLTVRWTNGLIETFTAIEGNRLVTIREGSGIISAEKWKTTAYAYGQSRVLPVP